MAMSRYRGFFAGSLRRRWRSFSRLLRTRYPAFVFGFGRRTAHSPVFVYHEVDAAQFEADLRFLSANGYRTLSAEEFLACDGRVPGGVFLTFDDARLNFYDVAFPLLQRYGARATVFAPTHWVGEALGDAPPGMFMGWDQLRTCARSGLVDVQAHGHRHGLIYTSARPVAFASPSLVARHNLFDWPWRREEGEERSGAPPLGTPIYDAEPILSAGFRLVEDGRASRACQDLVAAQGGPTFFENARATGLLRRAHAEAIRAGSRMEQVRGAAFEALVREEFERSRDVLEGQLGEAPVLFAYPWMLGSDLSVRCAAHAGFHAVFGVGFDFGRASRISGPMRAYGRIKGDWLRFLPGTGRRQLRGVIPERLRDFLLSQHLAH